MEESNQKIENYELGFHLLPELEEQDARAKAQEMETIISQLGGTVLISREPRKQRLSYPLKHKHSSLFGIISFKLPTEILDQLTSQLKLNDSIIRFLVLKTKENQKVFRGVRETTGRKIRTHTPAAAEQKPKEEIKPEVMEKQIEEVIGNL